MAGRLHRSELGSHEGAELDPAAISVRYDVPLQRVNELIEEARQLAAGEPGRIRSQLAELLSRERRPPVTPGKIPRALGRSLPPGGRRAAPAKRTLGELLGGATRPAALARRETGAAPSVPASLESLSFSEGRELPEALRRAAEALLGTDLSEVLIHTGSGADQAAAEIGARAFTIGPHVFFRRGRYQPETAEGRELLVHELTHAAQWIRGDVPAGANLELVREGDPLEREADRNATELARAFFPTAPPQRSARSRARRSLVGDAARLVLRDLEGEDAVCHAPPSEVPAGGTEVNRVGIVNWDGEPRLRFRATPSTEEHNLIGELAFNTRVQVLKEFPGDWYFVATADGQLGYVAKAYIWTELPDPNAQLHRVEGGVGGTAIAIAEQYYGEHADDWGQDLRFYVNVLAWANDVSVPNTTSGWREVHFQAGNLIWVPSQRFARSLKGSVNSGSYTYNTADFLGVAGVVERIGELWDDFARAIELAGQYIPEAIARHAVEGIARALQALVEMLLIAAFIMILATALGAAIGALAGGAGAAPGAAAGFEVGLAVLKWMGLAFLVVWVADALIQVGGAFGTFLGSVWNARGDEGVLDRAGSELAEALGLLVGKILEGLVMLAAARGIGFVMRRIGGTKFGESMGNRFQEWLTERVNARGRGESGRGQGESGRGQGESGRGQGESGRGQGESGRGQGESGRGQGESGRGTARVSEFTNRRASELIDSSQGRPSNGNSVGHAGDHIPPEGATRAQVEALARSRPTKQNTTVYRNRRHAIQDLRDGLNSRLAELANLQPGQQGLFFRFRLSQLRQGLNSQRGNPAQEVSFREISIYIERLADGTLHLDHMTPRIAGQ